MLFSGLVSASLAFHEVLEGYVATLLLCALPAFFFGFQEDLTKRVSARARLFGTLFSGALVWLFLDIQLPLAILPIDHFFVFSPIFSLVITALFIGTTAQGFNLIDGFNGLSGFSAIAVFTALFVLSGVLGDPLIGGLSVISIAVVSAFLVFNWPVGRLFLGDGGAYLLGFLASVVGIALFARHPQELSPATVVLICWLPILEVIFSTARRSMVSGRSPAMADRLHLHHLIYRKLVVKKLRQKNLSAQALVALFYTPFWCISTVVALTWYDSSVFALAGCLFISGAYFGIYCLLARPRG